MIKVRFTALRIALSSVLLAAMVGYIAYSLAPRLTVINDSTALLTQVSVHLPRSRVIFDNVAPGDSASIFHGAQQAEGRYNYIVVGEDGNRQVGSCGKMRESAYGLRMTIRVDADFSVECLTPELSPQMDANGSE